MALVAQSAPESVEIELRGQDELKGVTSTVPDLVLSLSKLFGGGTVGWGLENREHSKSLALKGPAVPLSSLAKASVASSEASHSVVTLASLNTFVACDSRGCSTASGSSREEDML